MMRWLGFWLQLMNRGIFLQQWWSKQKRLKCDDFWNHPLSYKTCSTKYFLTSSFTVTTLKTHDCIWKMSLLINMNIICVLDFSHCELVVAFLISPSQTGYAPGKIPLLVTMCSTKLNIVSWNLILNLISGLERTQCKSEIKDIIPMRYVPVNYFQKKWERKLYLCFW